MKDKKYIDNKAQPPGVPILIAAVFVVAVGLLLATATDALAQASSANFQLTSGETVSGGGGSVSASYTMVGCVPLTAGGVSGGANNTISGGVIPIIFGIPGFTATYDGALLQTVPKSSQTVKVAFVAGVEPTTGVFYYRLGGATAYQSAAMTDGTGDTLIYTVSADLLTLRGLEYYFVITQGTATVNIGGPGAPYRFRVQLTNAQAQRPTSLTALNYRIVGVPIDITGTTTVSAIFGDDLGTYDNKYWRLYSYNNATGTYLEYPAAANVMAGRGYWLIQRTPASYGASGFSFDPGTGYLSFPLDSGWNLVANPYAFDISWADVMFDTGGVMIGHSTAVIDDAAYWFNGSTYNQATTIPDWDGFFLFVKRPGVSIMFENQEAAKSAFKPLNQFAEDRADDNWRIHLHYECDGKIDDGNFAGVARDAEVGADGYDLYDPPPAPEGPRLAFLLPGDEPGLRRVDCRPPVREGAEWMFELSPGAERIITVTGVNRLPDNMQAMIVLDDGTIEKLVENSAVEPPESVVSGRLIVGTDAYFAERMDDLLPDKYFLEQNFPNPFNPLTSIGFSIPKPSHVYLTVYNILGQTVTVLVDEHLEAGHHVRTWDASDDNGRPVASGIYFYRLEAGDYILSRKMVLLK